MDLRYIQPPLWILLIAFTPAAGFYWHMMLPETDVLFVFFIPTFCLVTILAVRGAIRERKSLTRAFLALTPFTKITFGSMILVALAVQYLGVTVEDRTPRIYVTLFFLAGIFLLFQLKDTASEQNLRLLYLYSGLGFAVTFGLYIFWTATTTFPDDYHWGGYLALPGYLNGRHLAVTMPVISVGLLVFALEREKVSWLLFALAAITMGFAIWTGTRAVLFAYFASLPVIWIALGRPGLRVTGFAILNFIAAIPISYLVPISHRQIGFHTMFMRTNLDTTETLTSGRTILWRAAIETSFDRPLFGHGFDQFSRTALDYGHPGLHAHNGILTYIHAFGYPVAICFVVWLTLIWIKSWQAARVSTIGAVLFASLTVYLAFAMLAGLMYHQTSLIILMCLIGFICANLTQPQK